MTFDYGVKIPRYGKSRAWNRDDSSFWDIPLWRFFEEKHRVLVDPIKSTEL